MSEKKTDPTECEYHGLSLCPECNGEESMPDCQCEGRGWLLNGKADKGAVDAAFVRVYAARKVSQQKEMPARLAVLETGHRKVVAALGRDEPRVTELLAMVRALLGMLAWRPIETAPKDGTPILAWCNQYGIQKLYWSIGGLWVAAGTDATYTTSHWMPLPEAPQ